ncbi:MAG: hypothetical protein V1838_04690 [Patescibacteria group bacterium]
MNGPTVVVFKSGNIVSFDDDTFLPFNVTTNIFDLFYLKLEKTDYGDMELICYDFEEGLEANRIPLKDDGG